MSASFRRVRSQPAEHRSFQEHGQRSSRKQRQEDAQASEQPCSDAALVSAATQAAGVQPDLATQAISGGVQALWECLTAGDPPEPCKATVASISQETLDALKIIVLKSVEELHTMGAATSSDILDWIQTELSYLADTAAPPTEDKSPPWMPPTSRKARRRHQRSKAGRSPYHRLFGNNPLKSILQTMDHVSPIEHRLIQKVWHPADKERRLAKAHRLQVAAFQSVPHGRARVVNDMVAATALEAQPGGAFQHEPVYDVAIDAFIVHAILNLNDTVAAGRITEVLSLVEPPSLAAWLTSSNMKAVQNYVLALLVKENHLVMKVRGSGSRRSMIRYRLPRISDGLPRPSSDLSTKSRDGARKYLRRIAISELPPRVVLPPPQKKQKKQEKKPSPPTVNSYGVSVSKNSSCDTNATIPGREVAGEQLPPGSISDGTTDGQHEISKRKLVRMLKHHSLLFHPDPS